jgi:predicted nucleic acid-binding protein
MAATKVLLDTGPLVGYVNRKDQYHKWAVESWSVLYDPLWTCEAVLSEAVFVLQSEGASAEPILRMLDRGIIRLDFVLNDHRADIVRLLRKYADQPMSVADACLVRMAELADLCQVFTTDADFLVYRRKGRHIIPLLSPFQRGKDLG